MIIASLFGTSAGLEVYRNPIGEATSLTIDDAWIDISPDDVKLRGDSDVFCIFRRQLSGKTITWVGLYRSATEIGANRPGGFYGAGLWLVDCAVSSSAIYEVVTNLANQVKELAINNGKFVKKISEIRSSIVPPPQVKALLSGKAHISCGLSINGGGQAFITDPQNAIGLIEWAQKSSAAELFRKIIVGSPDQFVQQKNQYVAGFERFESVEAAADAAFIKRNSLKDDELRKLDVELSIRNKELAQKNNEIKIIGENLRASQSDINKYRSELTNSQSELRNLRQKFETHSARVLAFEGNKSKGNNSEDDISSSSSSKKGYRPSSTTQSDGVKRIPPIEINAKDEGLTGGFVKNIIIFLLVLVVVIQLIASFWIPQSVISKSLKIYSDYAKLSEVNKQLEGENSKLKERPTVEEFNNMSQQIQDLIRFKNQSAELSQTSDESNKKINEVSDQCGIDFQKYNYTIKADLISGPIRSEIYDQAIKASPKYCQAENNKRACGKNFSKNREQFVKDKKNLEGEIWLPKDCSFSYEINNKDKTIDFSIQIKNK